MMRVNALHYSTFKVTYRLGHHSKDHINFRYICACDGDALMVINRMSEEGKSDEWWHWSEVYARACRQAVRASVVRAWPGKKVIILSVEKVDTF